MADKLSNKEEETLLKLLLPGESGDENVEEVSEVDKLGTDTLFGFGEIFLGVPLPPSPPTVETSHPAEAWLSVPLPATSLLFVPSQATCTNLIQQY